MPIQTQDIKLLKSTVMADTPDGGGPMTGVAVIDGQSNNVFPDSSAMDRAFGRFSTRKLFGVAHTSDTATLMGTHVIVTDAPDDPLVHCTLFKTTGWSDTRTEAQATVERYLARGPVMSARIYDVHYAGSRQLNLLTFNNAPFPEPGDAIIILNPGGVKEQYVRIVKKSVRTENISFLEQSAIVTMQGTIATLELAQALEFDVLGPPPSKLPVDGAINARLFGVSPADGAYFYGIKPLEEAATVGSRYVKAADGIFTNLVPSATIETPIIDQRPYTTIVGLVNTGLAPVTLQAQSVELINGAVLTMPTPIQAGTMRITFGAFTLQDDGQGVFQNSGTKIGTMNYLQGKVYLSAVPPEWGTKVITCSYTPASKGESSIFSSSLMITLANRGLAYVTALRPVPMAGTTKVSFMAQGRWYDLVDNGVGKLVGESPEYGIGTLNYTSGSLSLTLGAIPDIDSHILVQWGDSQAAVKYAGPLMSKVTRVFPLDKAIPGGLTVEWTSGGVSKTATCGNDGALSGDATGYLQGSGSAYVPNLFWSPNTFPDADTNIVVNWYERGSTTGLGGSFVGSSDGQVTIQLAQTPVKQGSVAVYINPGWLPSWTSTEEYYPSKLYGDWAHDVDGFIYMDWYVGVGSGKVKIGTINYATGLIQIGGSSYPVPFRKSTLHENDPSWWGRSHWSSSIVNKPIALTSAMLNIPTYSIAAGTQVSATFPVATGWNMTVPASNGIYTVEESSGVFTIGSLAITSRAGTLYKNWDVETGAGVACGSISANGGVFINAETLSGGVTNTMSFQNLAHKFDSKPLLQGVFRTSTVPLKAGSFTLGNNAGGFIGTGSDAGVISGDFTGTIDYARGIVRWAKPTSIDPETLTYNAVFLQYMPLDSTLLGLNTSRLPLDGRVPIFRSGDLCVVHNTKSQALTDPVPRDSLISLGRERIAVVRVRDANGVVVPETLYTLNLNAGTIKFPLASDLTPYTQPLTVENRIEDLMVCSIADISGKLEFTRALTHEFPLGSSFVSSALTFGDLFARAHSIFEQGTWTGAWSDAAIGSVPLASFNAVDHPLTVSNRGAITERWALIFQTSTTFIVVGQAIGQIATGNVNTDCAPLNTAVGAPYFSIPALGWGSGWAAGNVLRFNTAACGAPFWVARTILQGPATMDSDQFSIALRGDIDRP